MTQISTIKPPVVTVHPSPRLQTLHEIEVILRRAVARDEGPLRLAEIKRRMRAKSVRHSTVRTCIDEMKRLRLIVEDPRRGVMWTLYEDPEFWSRKRVKL